jgi:hypothetical protein
MRSLEDITDAVLRNEPATEDELRPPHFFSTVRELREKVKEVADVLGLHEDEDPLNNGG